jgi:predicted PurR-regulated permease PerM
VKTANVAFLGSMTFPPDDTQSSLGKWIGFTIIVICLYVAWQIRQILLVLFMAIVLANALDILVESMRQRGIKRGRAILLTVLLLFVSLVGLVGVIIPSFLLQFQTLVNLVPRGINQLTANINQLLTRLDPNLVNVLPTVDEIITQLQPILQQIASRGLNIFYSSLGTLLSSVLLIALTLMLLGNPIPYRQCLIRLFPAFYRPRVEEILVMCNQALRGWLKEITFDMSLMTLLSLVGLSILGIPLALAQAILTGILTFIPNIGIGLSAIPPLAIALLEEPWKPLAVIFLYFYCYLITQKLDDSPRFADLSTYPAVLLPGFILLGQIFFATLFGILGLFLAVPLLIVGQIWLKEVLIKDILNKWE